MKIVALKKAEILIDEEDFEKIVSYSWWVKPSGYVYTQVKKKTIYLHRFLMGAKAGQELDHINRNKLDNRKANLRFCTRSQNNMNKSGVRGVTPFRGKWRVRIKKDRKEMHVGVFNTYEQAVEARQITERSIFGQFASI